MTALFLAGVLVGASADMAVARAARLAAVQPGDPEAGRALFTKKGCDRCHVAGRRSGLGPALEQLRRPQGEWQLAGRLWNHVPAMFVVLSQGGLEWPRIDVAEMVNLMAYLKADSARDATPDLAEGHVMLVRKGCLKCHSLGREGGPVKPDLRERLPEYGSAAAWATAMWAHTPEMAAMARRRGIQYPRFSGDEMGHLLGFLRGGASPAPASGSGTVPGR